MSEYEIGYRKPPRYTRFRKGVSGNPGGRPRGPKLPADVLRQALNARLIVTSGGERRSITHLQALLKSLVARAIKGDNRASALILNMMARQAMGELPISFEEALKLLE